MIPPGLVLAVSSIADGSMAEGETGSRGRFLRSLGLDPERLATCQQVHGTKVVEVAAPGVCAATDGLVTRERGLPLLILGADCPLICLYHRNAPAVALVHAGWRGLAGGILQAALSALAPVDPGGVQAFIAPCAGPCCYEIGDEVADQFPAAAVLRKHSGENPHLNLRRSAELALGLPIRLLGPECTICTDSHFSYRRNATTGRHALVAALR